MGVPVLATYKAKGFWRPVCDASQVPDPWKYAVKEVRSTVGIIWAPIRFGANSINSATSTLPRRLPRKLAGNGRQRRRCAGVRWHPHLVPAFAAADAFSSVMGVGRRAGLLRVGPIYGDSA